MQKLQPGVVVDGNHCRRHLERHSSLVGVQQQGQKDLPVVVSGLVIDDKAG